MSTKNQLSFNFDEPDIPEKKTEPKKKKEVKTQKKEPVVSVEKSKKKTEINSVPTAEPTLPELKPSDMKRAILAWLIPNKPSGIALNVPTRVSKYRADVAAFWSSPAKKRLMSPEKTVIVEIRKSREQCWPDCSKQEEMLPLLIQKKEEKSSLETLLRETEPELKDTDTLFPEYESWDYKRTKNRKYHKCLKELESIEHALYKGSRFEQIRRAHVADYLYLAVPAGTVNKNELADGWGLININPDMTTEVIKEADKWECPVQNKLHLIQNIASSCRKSILFSLGVNELPGGKIALSRIPRKRRGKLFIG